jgi:hypothetical protein
MAELDRQGTTRADHVFTTGYSSMATFVAFFITLLAVSKKADPATVFADVINATG